MCGRALGYRGGVTDPDGLEARARELLGPVAYDYFAGGADDEVTLAENEAAWRRIGLRPRVLRDVSAVTTRTSVLGADVASPVLVAPMAFQRLAHDEGEIATARAAASAGTVMIVSTFATVAMEDVAAASPGATRWFQLYVHRDRGLTADLVARAVAADYRALVLTVDLPVVGRRRRDERNRFGLPEGLEMANLHRLLTAAEGSGLAAYSAAQIEAGLTVDDIGWLRGLCDLPIVIKGVMRGDDAAAVVAAGAAAVAVSNHGGRQLDTTIATADALLDVVEAVAGRAEVYVDGGVRRGTDVVKALAMGAGAVLLGRPVLWGLAVGGADGAREVLEELGAETALAMALCGAAGPADVTFDLLA